MIADDRDSDSDGGANSTGGGSGSGGSGSGLKMGETLKKLLATGISAAFMTEESIRRVVSEAHLPKETIGLLLQGAARSKEELVNRVSREVIAIISKIDFVKEAARFAEEHKFRIVAEVEVLKKDPAKEPAKDQPVTTPAASTKGES